MITSRRIRLRHKRLGDARNDYAWQTDPELARLDAAPRLTIGFAQYLMNYGWELCLSFQSRCQFTVETLDGRHIGSCSYYDISETRGETELGIMVGDREYWDRGYGTETVTTLVSYIFQQTLLNRIYLKTLASNIRAQKCFEKCGFTRYGRMVKGGYDFVLMEIYRNQW